MHCCSKNFLQTTPEEVKVKSAEDWQFFFISNTDENQTEPKNLLVRSWHTNNSWEMEEIDWKQSINLLMNVIYIFQHIVI